MTLYACHMSAGSSQRAPLTSLSPSSILHGFYWMCARICVLPQRQCYPREEIRGCTTPSSLQHCEWRHSTACTGRGKAARPPSSPPTLLQLCRGPSLAKVADNLVKMVKMVIGMTNMNLNNMHNCRSPRPSLRALVQWASKARPFFKRRPLQVSLRFLLYIPCARGKGKRTPILLFCLPCQRSRDATPWSRPGR